MTQRDTDTFVDFCLKYDTEDVCVDALFKIKWPIGFRCPRCDFPYAYTISTRRLPLYECRSCHSQTSIIAGTIMEGSRTPLHLWFQAIYLHTRMNSPNALRLSEIIGVTYKTAWLICHKIRHAMSIADSHQLLTGLVHVADSVYCKRISTDTSWKDQEQPLLIGTSETEEGDLLYLKIKQQSKQLLKDKYDSPDPRSFIQQHVDPDATEQTSVYKLYSKKRNKKLFEIGWYVTNWIGSIYRGIGPKHLQAYLDQYAYLRNHNTQSLFNTLFQKCASTQTINYPNLTGSHPTMRSLKRNRYSFRSAQTIC